MKTLDYLPETDIYLYQDKEMFRINSDTRCLGEFLSVKKGDVLLDVGTNNGALLLYANKIGCKKLIGVDINSKAIELCKENLEMNKINNYELYNCKVQELNINKVDVIVCNPPYFKDGKIKDNRDLANARHELELTMEDLVFHSKRLLKDNGRLILVYKSNELIKVISEFDKNNIGITKLKFVFDSNKESSTCFLIEGVKNKKHNVKVLKAIEIKH